MRGEKRKKFEGKCKKGKRFKKRGPFPLFLKKNKEVGGGLARCAMYNLICFLFMAPTFIHDYTRTKAGQVYKKDTFPFFETAVVL